MNTRFNTDVLVEDLKNVVRDSEQLLAAVSDATGEKAEALRERLSESLATAKETCCKLEQKTKALERTTEFCSATPEQMKEAVQHGSPKEELMNYLRDAQQQLAHVASKS